VSSPALAPRANRRSARPSSLRRQQAIEGYLCLLPWLIGFVCFTAVPMLGSLALSLTKWEMISSPQLVGLANFTHIAVDPLFFQSLYNTAYISFISVPLGLTIALLIALGLNEHLRGVSFYRTFFFLPSQMPLVAGALVWLWVLNPDFGLANQALHIVGVKPLHWLFDVNLVKPSLITITLWNGVGVPMLIFLAGLQGVPESLYEAASIDGADTLERFRHITVPMISPVIFFNLIIGIIASFQANFTLVYITTQGGPANASLIYVLYLYFKAFQDFEMGYASALAWILLLIVAALTAFQFFLARRWVYYEGGDR